MSDELLYASVKIPENLGLSTYRPVGALKFQGRNSFIPQFVVLVLPWQEIRPVSFRYW